MDRRVGGGLLVVALLISLGQSASSAAAPAGSVATGGSSAALTGRTVTLITGDQVSVAGDGKMSIRRGKGRDAIRFVTAQVGGHLQVIPSDALRLIHTGRVDRRLFDVTTLLEFGYDKRKDLPLIVTNTSTRASVAGAGAQVVRELRAVNGFALRAAADTTFWAGLTKGAGTLDAGVGKIWLDGLRQHALDVSVPQIGAPVAWQAGFDGTGVTVGLLDSGADGTHPDLAGQIAASMNFTEGLEPDEDLEGHGTHVASTILGTGAASGGRYRGVAPGAKLLAGKVCAVFGCAESWILAGMQWVAENGATAVNMSLGGPDTPELDPIEQAVQTLTDQYGTLFVIAAGNSGPQPNTVASPGSADAALTVGAVDKSNELAEFSSRGPRIGDSALKPDITAPGVAVVAAFSTSAGGGPGNYYFSASGTSMATPHVVGATAILAQRRPDFSAAQLKATLMASAAPHSAQTAFEQGAGRVDVARAINQSILVDPPSVSFGRQVWPHNDDTPVTKTLTYRNIGAAEVTLSIAANAQGPDGNPAPAGMFTLSATTLTVPAGGQASVTMTADTRVGSLDGYGQGRLVATAPNTVVQTPFAVDREVESYDLTMAQTNREGQAPDLHDTLIVRTDQSGFFELFTDQQTASIRLPRGTYALFALQADFTEDPEAPPVLTFGVQPKLELTASKTVAFDARLSKPFSITLPRPGQAQVFGQVTGTTATPDGPFSIGLFGETLDGIQSLALGPPQRVDGFHAQVGGTWARLDSEGQPVNSPVVYNLAWITQGRMVTGATQVVRDRDLATVVAHHSVQDTGGLAFKGAWAIVPGEIDFPPAVGLPFELPFTRTEYFNTDGGAAWMSVFEEDSSTGEPQAAMLQQPQTYRAGRTYHEDWNEAVFGPAVGKPSDPQLVSTRTGDRIHVFVPMHGDGQGRTGIAMYTTARTALFKDGVKVGEVSDIAGDFTVPAASGRYRVEVDVQRTPGPTLSTKVSGVWTFRSGHSAGTTNLPLWTIGFSPALDERNTAPAGRAFSIPVAAVAAPGSNAGHLRGLRVEVSFDGGVTWRPAPVAGNSVRVTHPGGTGFVSLRANANDNRGNTVEQTIINAYRFG
ncbi:serine protease [Rhizocola hellebori]|uniref:Serine protease n=1 Tax=Rhizocola hellebori TaxID=1392758 RepID=A0A8J3Q6A6_9ACTN|nr:S8 family serine peptidase [Rhizocola hellebori]GIH04724.1 serine protease [Rhizocola hellebori]